MYFIPFIFRWWKTPINDLKLSHKYPKLKKNATCDQALCAMEDGNIAVITDENG